MTLQQLREKRAALEAQIKTIVAKADADQDGLLDAEQMGEIAAIEGQIDQVTATIKTRERMASRQTALDEPGQRVSEPGDSVHAGTIEVGEERQDPMCGFTSAAHFAHDVRQSYTEHTASPALREMVAAASTYNQEAVGADGGFAVPPQMRDAIWEIAFEGGDFIDDVELVPTERNQIILPVSETTPWGSTGVQAYWGAEAGTYTASKTALKPRNLTLHKLYAFVNATDELLDDAPLMENFLTRKAGAALRFEMSDALLCGDGVGKPLGIINSDCLVTVAKETSQTADTIVAANVAKMYGRLLGGGPRTHWRVHPDAFQQIVTMTLGNNAIWTPQSTGLRGRPDDAGYLLGLPIRKCEHGETVGDLGDIRLIDPDGYFCAQKVGGIKSDRSIHLYFDQGVEAFRFTVRLGGIPYLSAAVSPENGSSTRSHFVTLAARA